RLVVADELDRVLTAHVLSIAEPRLPLRPGEVEVAQIANRLRPLHFIPGVRFEGGRDLAPGRNRGLNKLPAATDPAVPEQAARHVDSRAGSGVAQHHPRLGPISD